jgi:hypothetical protein
VLFEVPTGVVADTLGRRASYLLGTVTLAASTLRRGPWGERHARAAAGVTLACPNRGLCCDVLI